MRKVMTRDGSYTYKNDDIDDHYHSISVGAIEEAMEKYVRPSYIKDNMIVLDYCFGLGYNTLGALRLANDLKVFALEADKGIIEKIKSIEVPESYKKDYEIIRKLARDFEYKDDNYDIRLIMGDARKTLLEIDEIFDIVFFDPFSPRLVPDMWTQDVFLAIFSKMRPKSRLTTYSCAKWVRNNLKKAGFQIENGPILGRRSPSTIAIKP